MYEQIVCPSCSYKSTQVSPHEKPSVCKSRGSSSRMWHPHPTYVAGTTHLLIGSSSTPNAVPAFLTNAIPPIATTLLCLDISANFLVALPPVLQACMCLEELNIASNPLRALPVFLAGLTSLRVLIADSTGISTLPPALSALDKLHALSVRRNKMNSLPSWLCLLPSLETLLVDGNPFLGPWKALVEPLLAKVPMSPLYPPSTPVFPPPSASAASVQSTTVDTDVDDLSDSAPDRDQSQSAPEDEDTIVPSRAHPILRSVTAPVSSMSPTSPSVSPTLQRTRTTPNKAYYDKYRTTSKSLAGPSKDGAPSAPSTSRLPEKAGEWELRKMKSAGELRRSPISPSSPSNSLASSPQRPALAHYATSASSSNLLAMPSPRENSSLPKRFASLGVSSALSPGGPRARPALERTVWDEISAEEAQAKNLPPLPTNSAPPASPNMGALASKHDRESRYTPEVRPKEEKSTKWGFLKKMSMGKMRSDPPAISRTPQSRHRTPPRPSTIARSISSSVTEGTPHIDVRISTTGTLLHPLGGHDIHPSLSRKTSSDGLGSQLPPTIPEVAISPSNETTFLDIPRSPQPPSPSLLSPAGTTSRSSKRRSFLPVDVSPIPIPAASAFMPAVQATNGSDDVDEQNRATPSPVVPDFEQQQKREEEKAKEARTRALRSVMAYLKDMHDLGLTQTTTLSVYGGGLEAPGVVRSRRPTVVEMGRIPSEGSTLSIISTAASSRTDISQLRSIESRMGMRSGTTTQTNSVATIATTDSGGSGGGEERKYKDDKGKRVRVVREIVE